METPSFRSTRQMRSNGPLRGRSLAQDTRTYSGLIMAWPEFERLAPSAMTEQVSLFATESAAKP
jgi:hypothetical protein